MSSFRFSLQADVKHTQTHAAVLWRCIHWYSVNLELWVSLVPPRLCVFCSNPVKTLCILRAHVWFLFLKAKDLFFFFFLMYHVFFSPLLQSSHVLYKKYYCVKNKPKLVFILSGLCWIIVWVGGDGLVGFGGWGSGYRARLFTVQKHAEGLIAK